MNKHRLLILAGKGTTTNILYNSLKEEYDIVAIIIERPVSIQRFLGKRIKKLGIVKVVGQILFQISIVPILNLTSRKRKKQILDKYNLQDAPLPRKKVIEVSSVNSSECISHIKNIAPELIIVNGTRIISSEVLNSTEVRLINIHAGITPKYRNVHGGYWAIVNNDYENCGVTVHLVDKGIDTGKVICQHRIPVTSTDNFATYPFLQIAEGTLCLKKALIDIFEKELTFQSNNLESKVWYHPTFWEYIYYRLIHKKK